MNTAEPRHKPSHGCPGQWYLGKLIKGKHRLWATLVDFCWLLQPWEEVLVTLAM